MRSSELAEALRLSGLQVFTVKDAARLIGKNINYTYLFLHKSRYFTRVKNGLYCLPGTDPMIVATRIVKPSYISLISAFSYYGLISQVPSTIKVVSTKRHAPIYNALQSTIVFRSVKKAMMFGYSDRHGIVVAEIEKAVVDSLYLNEDMQYISEVIENAKDSGQIDIEKLKRYAQISKVASISERLKRILNGW